MILTRTIIYASWMTLIRTMFHVCIVNDLNMPNVSNAVRQLNAIKLLQCNLDKESRLAIYRSYILSNFNYCSLVWHFCGIHNSRNMEKIQERALRFVYEDYESTYDILITKKGKPWYIIHRSLEKYGHWNI